MRPSVLCTVALVALLRRARARGAADRRSSRPSTTRGLRRRSRTGATPIGRRTATTRRTTSPRSTTRRSASTPRTTRRCSTRRWPRSSGPGSTRSPSRGGGRDHRRINACRRSSQRRPASGSTSPSTSSPTPAAPSRASEDISYLAALGIRTFYIYQAFTGSRRRLGGRERRLARRRADDLGPDTARRAGGRRTLQRRLHLRHRHLERGEVRPHLR